MRTGIAPGMACTGHSRPAAAISARCALAMPGIHSKFEHASTRATHPIGGVKTQFVLGIVPKIFQTDGSCDDLMVMM